MSLVTEFAVDQLTFLNAIAVRCFDIAQYGWGFCPLGFQSIGRALGDLVMPQSVFEFEVWITAQRLNGSLGHGVSHDT